MLFETLIQEDLQEIAYLQPPDWSDIIPHMQYYIEADFCIAIKTYANNKISGIGALINYKDSAWLAHIIVDPEQRNIGIGTAIVKTLLDHSSRKPDTPVLLSATPLGEPLYNKLGFRPAGKYVFFKRERTWNDYSWCDKIKPFQESFRDEMLELDRSVTGENRQSILSPVLEKAFVYLSGNAIQGFFLPIPGEGTILATTADAGIELMKIKYALADEASLPEENLNGITFLKSNGFRQTDKIALRMVLGNNVSWKPQNIYSRIGGNFG